MISRKSAQSREKSRGQDTWESWGKCSADPKSFRSTCLNGCSSIRLFQLGQCSRLINCEIPLLIPMQVGKSSSTREVKLPLEIRMYFIMSAPTRNHHSKVTQETTGMPSNRNTSHLASRTPPFCRIRGYPRNLQKSTLLPSLKTGPYNLSSPQRTS